MSHTYICKCPFYNETCGTLNVLALLESMFGPDTKVFQVLPKLSKALSDVCIRNRNILGYAKRW